MQTLTILDITIDRILHNKPNQYDLAGVGFIIAKASTAQGERVVVKGSMENCICFESYRLFGEYVEDEKYKDDTIFRFASFHVVSPTTRKGAFKYFMTYIKDVGKVYASTIVDELGDNAIDLLIENPSLVFDIKDIGEKAAKSTFNHFTSSKVHHAKMISDLTALNILRSYSSIQNLPLIRSFENFGSNVLWRFSRTIPTS